MAAARGVRELVDGFVNDLELLIREEIRRGFAAAMGETSAPSRAASRGRRAARPAPAPVPARAGSKLTRASRKKGEKRTPAELKAVENAVLALIQKTPGQRVEQIKAVLGVPTSELARPLAKLIAAKKIKTTGQRRGTKYFPK